MKNTVKLFTLCICLSSMACVQTEKKNTAKVKEESSCCAIKTSCCDTKATNEKTAKISVDSKSIYYFHGKRRCKTCLSISKLSKETAKKLSTDEKTIVFHDIDFDDSKNADLVEKFKVAGSSLFVVDSEGKITDITAFAFTNALNNADKCKEKITNLL